MNEEPEKNYNVYNGDKIIEMIHACVDKDYLIVRCENSVYRIDIETGNIKRLL